MITKQEIYEDLTELFMKLNELKSQMKKDESRDDLTGAMMVIHEGYKAIVRIINYDD